MLAAAAPPVATVQPVQQAQASGLQQEIGVTEEVINKFQEKATVLTAERKKRGKQLPEGLATVDDIKVFKQTSSHTVCHQIFRIFFHHISR